MAKKKEEIKDRIIQVDSREKFMEDMAVYSLYVMYNRYVPDIRDGLKPVQRRIITAMYYDTKCISESTKRKSAKTVGDTMGIYHPHGDCLRHNTKVYMLNNKIATIGELYNAGITSFEALGINSSTLKAEPILVHDLRIGQYTNKVYHIQLSNGGEICCTSNHPIMLYNGIYKKAEELSINDLLFTNNISYRCDRPYLSNNGLIQNIVSDYYNGKVQEGYIRHHIDGNPFNNLKNNLTVLSRAEHALLHNDYNTGLENGRIAMATEGTNQHTVNRIKNSKLCQLYNSERSIRNFKYAIKLLVERNLPITEENYESLRSEIHNLTKIDTLVNKGIYGSTFEELVNYELPSIGDLYNEYKSSLIEMIYKYDCNDNNKYKLLQKSYCNRIFNKIIINKLPINYDTFCQYCENSDWLETITFEQFSYWYNEYCISHPFITNIWIEDVDNEPMYDFTVDSTNNMLIPVGEIIDGILPMVCAHNSSIYDAMKPMTNWFETKEPIITYESNSGTFQGAPQAKMRYTESYLNKFGVECVIGEMAESKQVVDWQPTFDNHALEPESLAVKVPLLLINGTFSIAIGSKIEIPKHSLNDVIDATLAVMHDPNYKVILIPDPCMQCEIVNTDWKKISNEGYGNYIVRGIIEVEHTKKGNDILHIKSVPDLVYSDSIKDKIEELVAKKVLIQIDDIQDHSTDTQLDLQIILKKGADSEYVKQVIYKQTSLQQTNRVNMEVLLDMNVQRVSYKAYLLYFLDYRRNIKFRLYNYRLQKCETRLHQIDTYIKILESGDVENIIHMIRNQNSMEESYLIDWLMKKLKITDLQAKFVLHTEIGRLSKGHLNKYKEEQNNLNALVNNYINIITHPEIIDQEIEQELLDIKAKYGKPRMSILIDEADANNIPKGEFKIVITEANFIKKMQVNDDIKSFKGDNAKCVLIADNSKDILLFDEQGKVFKLPVSKIAFTDKNSPGIDIRLLIKKLTSNIRTIMYLPMLETLANKSSKYFIVVVSSNGMIKKMDLNDIINSTPGGIIYSRLNQGDSVRDIIIANHKSDIIVYSKSKALRLKIDDIPYLKRSTIGNKTMSGNEGIDGMAVVTPETTDVVVVTNKGKFNRFSITGLPVGSRGKAGGKVIKLAKGDYINNIFSCNENKLIRVIRPDEIIDIPVRDIPIGSSISPGVKLTKDGIIKCELIRG